VRHRFSSVSLVLMLLVLVVAEPAHALRFQERATWMAGVAWGFGRGIFNEGSAPFEPFQSGTYRYGSLPQIHFGFKPWTHFMVGAHYEAWMIEFGAPPTKYRRSMQNLSAGLTWFPGRPEGVSGGIYVRAGGGSFGVNDNQDACRCDRCLEVDGASTRYMGIWSFSESYFGLMAKVAGDRDPKEIYREICETVDGPISAEVVGTDKDTMLVEGRKLAALHENIVVKLPLTEDGLKESFREYRERYILPRRRG